jgi:deoxyribonuclease V
MADSLRHSWDVSPREAAGIQSSLRPAVEREDRLGPVGAVAGIDLAIRGGAATVAIVVLSFPDLRVADSVTLSRAVTFPYVPGLLAFREAPPILAAYAELRLAPDLLIFDGHGLAHPRRMGIACHVGLVLDLPSIGCAKSILCGQHPPLVDQVGAWAPVMDGGEIIGAAVRTRQAVRPVYVSTGHRVSLDSAIRFVLACCRGRRLPEPTRLAHLAAGQSSAQ